MMDKLYEDINFKLRYDGVQFEQVGVEFKIRHIGVEYNVKYFGVELKVWYSGVQRSQKC